MALLNHKLKWPATAVFYAALLFGAYSISFENQLHEIWKVPVYSIFGDDKGWTETSLINEILTVIIVTAGLIASFSKERIEDELTSKIRLESLSIAIVLNYLIVLIANFVIFDFAYLNALMVFLFTPLVMFNIIYQVRLYNYYRLEDEK